MTKEEYKNITKRIVITLVIATMTLGAVVVSIMIDSFESGRLYTMKGIVTEVDEETRQTIFVDESGERWGFYGIKNWTVGDTIKLTVNSKDTIEIYDDEVIGAEKVKSFKEGIN